VALDYELDDQVVADRPAQVKALADPLRSTILDLVLERAATVSELAEAVDRPKSSVAYHVDVLVDLGLLKVVRTRRVRAIEERFYGRVGRTIVLHSDALPDGTASRDLLSLANSEVREPRTATLLATLRHARIPDDAAEEFFERVVHLAEEFTRVDRGGDTVFGFVGAVYETDGATLPVPLEVDLDR
jgi:DNA-binding transcriptional ArsR family regulator